MPARFFVATLFVTSLSIATFAQNAPPVVGTAAKAMGVETLNSITYSGSARNGAFGQSRSIANAMGPTNVTQITSYTRTINFGAAADPMTLVSRAFGPTMPPVVPGAPPPMPGNFNQNITAMQLGANWGQALNVWTTPWGFLKGAAANNATVRQQGGQQVVVWSPPNLKSPSGQPYSITGYINNQNLVTKVETRVEHAVFGDLLVEFDYSNYQNMNGVQVPTRIVQRQGGLQTFDATITAATPNPSNMTELLTVPPPAGRGAAPAAAAPAQGGQAAAAAPAGPPVTKLGEGVFKIGGNYTALAVDMGDHIVVVESGQSDARGMAVMAAAKQAIPNKPIRFVVNSHPHFDHASGLAAAAAEGATILTHRNNEDLLERALSGPRTLSGDSLSKVANRRISIDGVGDRQVLKGSNGKVIELHHVQGLQHSDGMLMAYLPAEKALYTADFNFPAANAPPGPPPFAFVTLRQNIDRLKLDYETFVTAHLPNPERPLTRADVDALTRGTN
jgi:glyoxylase-like metal-dependent hydrolase (beta-lactamase superfamily II)